MKDKTQVDMIHEINELANRVLTLEKEVKNLHEHMAELYKITHANFDFIEQNMGWVNELKDQLNLEPNKKLVTNTNNGNQ